MFFLVPRITLLLLVVFFVFMGLRARRRKLFGKPQPRLKRIAVRLGQRSGRRSGRRRDPSGAKAQSDSLRPS